MKLHTKILLGLIVSLALGIVNLTVGVVTVGVANTVVETVNQYGAVPLGQIFLRILFMVVMPLVCVDR